MLYFPKKDVVAGFAKGAILSDVGAYQVHTSRREKAGIAEVHTLDTDIFYMQEGEATIVTGGAVPDLKEVEPNEWRGGSIQGGETRQLSPGDVLIIPNGVPHWFKTVKAPVIYFTVKVRANA